MSKQLTLAYCADNRDRAEQIINDLAGSGYTFNLTACTDNPSGLGVALSGQPGKIILLVSDNFLKATACMKDALSWFQSLDAGNRLLPVVIDGWRMENGERQSVTTSFDRVSNVIKYMNFWQEKYLELRKEKREEDDVNAEKLKTVRNISTEVGEFLRHIRGTKYVSFNDFSHNNYEQFFTWNNDKAAHAGFQTNHAPAVSQTLPVPEEVTETPPASENLPAEPPVQEVIPAENIEVAAETAEQIVAPAASEDSPVEPPAQEVIPAENIEVAAETAEQIVAPAESENLPAEPPAQEVIPAENIEAETVEQIVAPESKIDIPDETLLAGIPGIDLLSNVAETETESTDADELSDDLEELLNDKQEDTNDNDLTRIADEVAAEETEDRQEDLDDLDDEIFEENPAEDEAYVGEETRDDLDDFFAEDQKESLSETEEEETIISDDAKRDDIERILTESKAALTDGRVPEALNTLRAGTEKYADQVHLRYYYAYVLANSANNFEEAKDELQEVLQQAPGHADAHYLRGEIAEFEQDWFTAKKSYARVIGLNGDYPNVHYRIATVLANHFAGQDELAADYFKIALKRDKTNADAHFQAARLYERKLNNPEKAKKYYKKTLKLEPHNAEIYLGLARIARSENDAAKAIDYYRQAVDVDSNLATERNQRLFAPDLVSGNHERSRLSAEKMQRLQQENESLQSKLSELESLLEKQTADQEKISQSLQQMTAGGKELSNGHHAEATDPVEPEAAEPTTEVKTVFITGATSGIGKATAEIFARNGHRLIITGRRAERLEKLRNDFQENYHAEVRVLNYDVRDPDAVRKAVHSLEGEMRVPDILINNAGLAKGFSSIHEGEMRHWEQMIDTNIKGLLYMTRAVSPGMVARRSGHIINVCSTAGHEVYPNGNVYCATKHAVDALTKSMRIDLHKHNIRVSQVSPGHVEETEFAVVRFDGDKERAKIYEDFRPLRAADVAEAIYFMATRPAHVNVQDILMMGTQQANSNYLDRSGR